ncbi:MAG: PTS sugar transporter subunit IIA [Alphaproteobacteria bacterium]
MIGIVIVTHGRLATEFRGAVEHIVGAQDAFEAVAIGPDDDMEKRRSDVMGAVKAADRGNGVIILTDMFGGTPCNLAISVMEAGSVEVIAGLNLPMLIKLVRIRSDARLDEAVVEAADAGRKYISVASNVLAGA